MTEDLAFPELDITRTLWFEQNGERSQVDQDAIRGLTGPVIVLGEPGMGKSHLLAWLGSFPDFTACRAGELIGRIDPHGLIPTGQVPVIDALDEVTSIRDGDALHLVLEKLGALGNPRFVIACRVADWASAVGRQAVQDRYGTDLHVLHLNPLRRDDYFALLESRLGPEVAQSTIDHFNAKGLEGILGNPQTLDMVLTVSGRGPLPETRGDLFKKAVEVMRSEHKDIHAKREVAEEEGLMAAGAAFAALILTGSNAITRTARANLREGDLLLADVEKLPSATTLSLMLSTRLFRAGGADKFTYWHRQIGEFLGAQWLAKIANTAPKRKRILAAFHSNELVPSSLRGIHAWLARDPHFTSEVIEFDPLGYLEYGDVDALSPTQCRCLLLAIKKQLSTFRHFNAITSQPLRILVHPELSEDLEDLIQDSSVSFGLQNLILRSIKLTGRCKGLEPSLSTILLDDSRAYVNRECAAIILLDHGHPRDWPNTVDQLLCKSSPESVRLAVSLIVRVSVDRFSNEQIALAIVKQAENKSYSIGDLWGLVETCPIDRIESLLDTICGLAPTDAEHGARTSLALQEFVIHWIYRLVRQRKVNPASLARWLLKLIHDPHISESRRNLDATIAADDELRRGVHRQALEYQDRDGNFSGFMRLSWAVPSLRPKESDVIALLEDLNPSDQVDGRWRRVVMLAEHGAHQGHAIRQAAHPFAQHNVADRKWLDDLASPVPDQWLLEYNARQKAKLSQQHELQRSNLAWYVEHSEDVRRGQWQYLVHAAKVYLNYDNATNISAPAHERTVLWLGQDFAEVFHAGFEVFLQKGEECPSASQVAEGIIDQIEYSAEYIIMAALAERVRKGIALSDLSDDRLLVGYFSLRRFDHARHARIEGLVEAVDSEVQARDIWLHAMRTYYETQLKAGTTSIDGLPLLMRDELHATAACELAAEWLNRFLGMSASDEEEMISRLVRSGRADDLRELADTRVDVVEEASRSRWDAIGFLVNHQPTHARLRSGRVDPNLIWPLRDFTAGYAGEEDGLSLSLEMAEWIIATFRIHWPHVGFVHRYNNGGSAGATEYLVRTINRLGASRSENARSILQRLIHAAPDSYTETLRVAFAQQLVGRVEASYKPLTLEALRRISEFQLPNSASDFQAYILQQLEIVQKKIKSDDVDSWRGFFDKDGNPYREDRCRDYVVGLLRQGESGISFTPELHLAEDKEVDVACQSGDFRLPIEVKGQWNAKLWVALEEQLVRFYAKDWKADGRGIYLVLWFGWNVEKKHQPRTKNRNAAKIQTAQALRAELCSASTSTSDGRVEIFVLDLTRDR